MIASWKKEPVVLAVYFNTRGFGYVVFEGLIDPIEWGIKTPKQRNKKEIMKHVALLLHLFDPDVVVLQNCDGSFMHCSERTRVQIKKTAALARDQEKHVVHYTRLDIRNCFSMYSACTKVEIAHTIAQRIPAFQRYVPPPRKSWMKEDYHMGIFDAAALTFTHFLKDQFGSG